MTKRRIVVAFEVESGTPARTLERTVKSILLCDAKGKPIERLVLDEKPDVAVVPQKPPRGDIAKTQPILSHGKPPGRR